MCTMYEEFEKKLNPNGGKDRFDKLLWRIIHHQKIDGYIPEYQFRHAVIKKLLSMDRIPNDAMIMVIMKRVLREERKKGPLLPEELD